MEWMMAPDSVWMVNGALVGCLLQTGVVVEKKCAVHPELAMT